MMAKPNYGIQACGYDVAVSAIARNDASNTFAYIELLSPPESIATGETRTPHSLGRLEQALGANTTLKVLHVTTNGCGRDVVLEVCRGLRSNTSLETVVWYMSQSDRTPLVAAAILDWIVARSSNGEVCGTALTKLRLQRLPGHPAPARHALGANAKATTHDSDDNAFAQALFPALAGNSHLSTFHLESYVALSNESKECFYNMVEQRNTSLRDVFIEFHERDYRLTLLTAFNIGQWKRRWIVRETERVEPSSEPDNGTALTILEEVLASLDELQAVAAIYELLRHDPSIIQ